ncbi:hypothetical protein MUP79_10075 [Candidatus Bathyarchaeota archaeon]|nr:hypothetical protein [Candidatus Bathyarchaeota archaeon]
MKRQAHGTILVFLIVSVLVFAFLRFGFVLPVHATGLALDGSVYAASSGNKINLVFSTSTDNDVIIVAVGTDDHNTKTVSSITSNVSTSNFTKRTSKINAVSYYLPNLEEWCANWTSHGAINITVTLSGTPSQFGLGIAFGISGATTASSSFDSNAGANPTGSGIANPNPSVSITTSNADDFIFGLFFCDTYNSAPTVGSAAFTSIQLGVHYGSEYKIVSSTQSSTPVNFTTSGTFCYWCLIADAVMQASAGDVTKPTYSGVSTNSTVWATSCNFSITANDETALHPNGQYIFGCNNTGAFENETAINFTVTSQFVSIAKTLNSTNSNATSPEIVQFEWWFSDNAGNLNNTGLQTLTLCWQLSVGWNNVTIFEFDAGYTLAGTNASLNYDSINWTYIVYQNSSTTAQYVFVKNMSANNLVRVYQTTGILLVFCNQAGNWTHTYPYQGGDYGEDPDPIVIAAVAASLVAAVSVIVVYKKLRKKKVR